jgi:hypothetical protein
MLLWKVFNFVSLPKEKQIIDKKKINYYWCHNCNIKIKVHILQRSVISVLVRATFKDDNTTRVSMEVKKEQLFTGNSNHKATKYD